MKKKEIKKIARFIGLGVVVGSWYFVMFNLAFKLIQYLIVDKSNFESFMYTFAVIVMFWSSYLWFLDRIIEAEKKRNNKDEVTK